jgi:hypothetical protein
MTGQPADTATLAAMSWVLVVTASLGSGAVAALVTTYGSQTRERRAARVELASCLRRVEQMARHPGTSQEYHRRLVSALDDLESAMLVAALPYYLAAFYRDVRMLAYATRFTEPQEDSHLPRSHQLISGRVAHQTAILLAKVIWHPWLTVPIRRRRVRRLQQVLDGGMPERARMRYVLHRSLREWERSLTRPLTEDGEAAP